MPETLHITLSKAYYEGQRLDAALADALPDLSRSRLQTLIKQGHVLIEDQPVKARQAVILDQEVVLTLPDAQPAEAQPEAMDLDILFEDEHLLVLNKPHGLVVHPGAGNTSGTLVNALLAHCGDLSSIGGVERPGIVHRLDKDTSGGMVVAKNDQAHQHLSEQFAQRTTQKHYLAVVQGRPSPSNGRIENHLGRHPVNRQKMAVVDPKRGKPAVTDYQAGPHLHGASLVHCHLHTGRTHQIRVHLHSLGHPLLGDPIYGKRQGKFPQVERLLLHSWILGFRHPATDEPHIWTTSIPEAFEPWLTDPQWLQERAKIDDPDRPNLKNT